MPALTRSSRRFRHLVRQGGLLAALAVLVYGGVALGVQSLIGAFEPRWIGPTVELPMGSAQDAFVDRRGTIYAASEAWSRIQVYDRGRRFLRGWFVDATGAIKVRMDDEGHVRVLNPRTRVEFVFDTLGRQLWVEGYSAGKLDEFNAVEEVVPIPTAWYLVPFAHTSLAMGILVAGMGLVALSSRPVRRPRVAGRTAADVRRATPRTGG